MRTKHTHITYLVLKRKNLLTEFWSAPQFAGTLLWSRLFSSTLVLVYQLSFFLVLHQIIHTISHSTPVIRCTCPFCSILIGLKTPITSGSPKFFLSSQFDHDEILYPLILYFLSTREFYFQMMPEFSLLLWAMSRFHYVKLII